MLPYHEDEVGKSRRVHRTASTRAHDQRELRYHARGQHVELEQKYKKKGKEVVERGGKGVVYISVRAGDWIVSPLHGSIAMAQLPNCYAKDSWGDHARSQHVELEGEESRRRG